MIDDKKLVDMAIKAREMAYAPYSGFRVGACVRGASGKLYTGCNVENASYGAACCAERVALYAAVAAGERELTHVAVASDSAGTTYPCGICRQAIHELAPDARVLCAGRDGAFEAYTAKDLLPHAFTLKAKDEEQDL